MEFHECLAEMDNILVDRQMDMPVQTLTILISLAKSPKNFEVKDRLENLG
jgi:hypothetical protein